MNTTPTKTLVSIPQHNWRGEVVGYEVREANAPRDTAADVIRTFSTAAEADAFINPVADTL